MTRSIKRSARPPRCGGERSDRCFERRYVMRELSTAEMAITRGVALNVAAALSVESVALAMTIYISVLSNGIFGTGRGTAVTSSAHSRLKVI